MDGHRPARGGGPTALTLKLRWAGTGFSGWRMEPLPNQSFAAEQGVTSGQSSPPELHFGFMLQARSLRRQRGGPLVFLLPKNAQALGLEGG